MSKKTNCSSVEKTIKCRRCRFKFPVKIGAKNNGSLRKMDCPRCKADNYFRVDENGKIHCSVS